jgi:hypothetical protein
MKRVEGDHKRSGDLVRIARGCTLAVQLPGNRPVALHAGSRPVGSIRYCCSPEQPIILSALSYPVPCRMCHFAFIGVVLRGLRHRDRMGHLSESVPEQYERPQPRIDRNIAL